VSAPTVAAGASPNQVPYRTAPRPAKPLTGAKLAPGIVTPVTATSTHMQEEIQMDDKDKKANRKGAEHQAKGTKKEVEGKVEKNVGKATGDRSKQAKGAVKEAGGKMQKKAGEAMRKSAN
jgi:uncharacterized protein YjbJ (UPF0337 family)